MPDGRWNCLSVWEIRVNGFLIHYSVVFGSGKKKTQTILSLQFGWRFGGLSLPYNHFFCLLSKARFGRHKKASISLRHALGSPPQTGSADTAKFTPRCDPILHRFPLPLQSTPCENASLWGLSSARVSVCPRRSWLARSMAFGEESRVSMGIGGKVFRSLITKHAFQPNHNLPSKYWPN